MGEMPIQDPTKYHVMLIKSDNPLELRWRIFVPAKTDTNLVSRSKTPVSSSNGMSSFMTGEDTPGEGLVIANFYRAEGSSDMQVRIRSKSRSSRGMNFIGVREEVVPEIVGGKDSDGWKIAGMQGVEVGDIGKVLWLLQSNKPQNGPFFEIGVGTKEAINKE